MATLVLCASLAAHALAASGNFLQPASSPEGAGDQPFALAAADLDGDTDQDLVVANRSADNVTILRNSGNGNLSEPATSPEAVGETPVSVAAGDLDGDTDQDLVVANGGGSADGDLTILLNNGSGNFVEPATSPEVGHEPRGVAVADLDGDTDQDIAVAELRGGLGARILKNDGTGDFASADALSAGTSPSAITAADLDGDTDKDLAVASRDSDDVTILKNNGTGHFFGISSSPEPAGDAPIGVVAADLDADTDNDLAVVDANADDVTILRNNGTGNFFEPVSSPEGVGDGPRQVVAADFDGDGDVDLAVANRASDDVTILKNKSNGDFFEPASSPEAAGDSPNAIVGADLDGDADTDLGIANSLSDNVTILRNR